MQILDRRLSKVVGTGTVVSREGHIATCRHVVRDAGVEPAERGGEVGVRRPRSPELDGWKGIAALVATVWPDYGDDVVLLRLLGDRTFDDNSTLVEQTFDERDFARLGSGEGIEDKAYRSYGSRTSIGCRAVTAAKAGSKAPSLRRAASPGGSSRCGYPGPARSCPG